jgi:hypothetical protein
VAPTGFTATPGSTAGTLVLDWTPGGGATGHYVLSVKKADIADGSWTSLSYVMADSDSGHTLTSLESGEAYYVTVASVDGTNRRWFKPLPEATPN